MIIFCGHYFKLLYPNQLSLFPLALVFQALPLCLPVHQHLPTLALPAGGAV